MRLLLGIMIAYMMIPLVHSQSNHIFSGGEVIIHGILDISSVKGVSWSSDRNIKPGYFSLIENASYTGYSDAANIDGYVKKYGNSPFLFPEIGRAHV